MRRIALLLSAAMLTLVGTSAAQAQNAEYGDILTEPGATCVVTLASTATSDGAATCTVGGLKGGTQYQIVLVWQALTVNGASFSASVVTGDAVAFVGAQGALTTTIDGTTNPNGNDTKAGPIPAGADSSKPASLTLTGTAADGTPAVVAGVVNAQAAQPETTPATGAESGTLALIAAGALVLGAGALVATRRRKTEMVA